MPCLSSSCQHARSIALDRTLEFWSVSMMVSIAVESCPYAQSVLSAPQLKPELVFYDLGQQ
jgi:hypothetical protein